MEGEYLPECWQDDERMNYLFSAFRENRESNQNDWDTKITFWKKCVGKYCKHKKTLFFGSDQISNCFQRNGVIPMGMEIVLKDMLRNREVILKDDYERNIGAGWISWGADLFLRKPVRWAYHSVVKGNQKIPPGSYIVSSVLKEMSEEVLQRYTDSSSSADNFSIFEFSKFEASISDICSDETSKHLVILNLQKLKKVLVETLPDGCKIIKFAPSKLSKVEVFTESEKGIFSLRKTILSLEEQIVRFTIDIKEHHQQARTHIHNGLKSSAKHSLRKKKMTQQKQERREGTLAALQELLDKIQSAKTDQVILEAYRAGSTALKHTLSENKLTPESVDDTMSEVQEVMEMCNEINDSMARGQQDIDDTINLDIDLDPTALEAELDELMNTSDVSTVPEQNPSNPAQSQHLLDYLPSIPESLPGEQVKRQEKKMIATT